MIETIRQQNAEKFRKKTCLEFLTEAESAAAKSEIEAIALERDAELYTEFLDSEMNMTAMFGTKRSDDPIDDSNHGKALASSRTVDGLSHRGIIEGIADFARAVAWHRGDSKVTKAHIDAVAPYALMHRMRYTDDFKSEHVKDKRDCMYARHLSQIILEGISKNFAKYVNLIRMFDQYKSECQNGRDPAKTMLPAHYNEVCAICSNPEKNADHPYIREWALIMRKFDVFKKHLNLKAEE